ncbi:hypothetical protein J2794_005797 [Paraburkholderia terricola]|nr:hypothetical protein [Paraburkholderia terricola]
MPNAWVIAVGPILIPISNRQKLAENGRSGRTSSCRSAPPEKEPQLSCGG